MLRMLNFPQTVLGFYAKNLYKYAKCWPWLYMFFSVFDTAGFTIIPAFFIKMTVAALEGSSGPDAFVAILPVAAIYVIARSALVIGGVMRWVVFDSRIRYHSYNAISRDLYDYVFKQSLEFYSNSMPGKINSQIDGVANGFWGVVRMIFGNFSAVIVAFILSAGGLFSVGWQYLVVIFLGAAGRIIWGAYRVKSVLKASANSARKLNHLHGRLLDALSNFLVVKSFARDKYEQESVAPDRREYEHTARIGHFTSRWYWAPGNFLVSVVGMTCLILLSGYMYAKGQSSLADVSFVLSVYIGIDTITFNLIVESKDFFEMWGKSVGSYAGLIAPLRVVDKPGANKLKVKRGVITFKNVSFRYGRKNVLNNLSFKIAAGERVGIVGMSGAGKTTLVNLLMRFYDVGRGGIYIDGTDIRDVTQESLREQIAFIPQDTTMFNRTIRENIAYGNMNASDKEIKQAAHNASADKFINSTPKKYDTIVGDRGIKLSGGQRQRISIARAFLKNAPILILDEATSALDSETESVIQEAFGKLSSGRTTLVIAHRLSTLRNMDRIIVLDKGQIVETGTHKALLRRNGIYSHLWKMQSGGFISE